MSLGIKLTSASEALSLAGTDVFDISKKISTSPDVWESQKVSLTVLSTSVAVDISGKVDKNSPITGSSKTKITYDSKGLVTGGADATTADIASSTNKNYVNDAQLVVIGNTGGTNTGDETNSTILTKLGYTPENAANKSTNVATDIASSTKYPAVSAIVTWIQSLFVPTSTYLSGIKMHGIPVDLYGAIGDGVTNDMAAIQAAIDDNDGLNGFKLIFSKGKTYYVAGQINLPKNGSGTATYLIEGYGAKILTDQAIHIFDRTPTNQTEAESVIGGDRFIFKGLLFYGVNIAGQMAINLGATYGSKIVDCNFAGFDTGVCLRFALKTVVENCMFVNCTTANLCGYGDWSGANFFNSQSNSTIYSSNRVYNYYLSLYSFRIIGCSGVRINNCIIEGDNPQYGISFTGSSVALEFKVKDLHLECAPTVAGITFNGVSGSYVEIDTIYSQYGCTLIEVDATCATDWTLFIKNIPYLPATTKFKCATPNNWVFENSPLVSVFVQDSAHWISGVKPSTLYDYTGPVGNAGLYLINPSSHYLQAGSVSYFLLHQIDSILKSAGSITMEAIGLGDTGYVNLKTNKINYTSGNITSARDSQLIETDVKTQTTSTTPLDLIINRVTNIVVPENTSYTFIIAVNAFQVGGVSGTIGDTRAWFFRGLIKNVGGVTSLVGDVIEDPAPDPDAGAAAWTVVITAVNSTVDYLAITATGGDGKTINWTAGVKLIQNKY